ncbi:hypothetical protein ACFQPA_11660 [Halomarina halobia]|uniref:DUF7981 domain-containing protein n=1 Tax=Halomarina halobia TaxID=3033386 RepID=A0ABD6AA96_9EURY|nr:hypothetical protein [Halomarina sp. PSR21]
MRPRLRSSLLWGLVGAMAFVVLVQGYDLAVARLPVGLPARLALAAVVGAVVASAAYATEHRLHRRT